MVQIIPKETKEISGLERNLLYFLFFLIIALAAIFFVLFYSEGKNEEELFMIKERLEQVQDPQAKEIEKEVIRYKTKLDDFKELLEGHVLSSKIFSLIEEKTHPQVSFSQLSFDEGTLKLKLTGKTDSFSSLGQQISILKEEPSLEDVSLASVFLLKQGGVGFTIDILMNEELIKF